ncbi:PREDICTED: uncharacterized protein LOC109583138 [Amphimedon queenslandica]|uniref:Uncharacterized protein n=2 Tax=Amphimedon queenslandica TaxID=400682 RepID=A0AAN0JAW2_AMPQE|nr:PREDICTED: uncharacterized protein LOC109583138 [Amphimedon queenslandica]|eukprot:XP_019853907.1 PREDICTED: uncharacterized protein LOC109583138 [Amphimedon queenslandica]
MAEGFASSRVEPMVELSTSLVALNDAVSSKNLDIIKLVAKHAFGIGQQDLDEADVLTSVYYLLERQHDSSALNILILILMRLGIDTVLVGALKKHVKQNEIVIEGYQKVDFILTVSCILRSLHKRQYKSLKEMARRTFLNNYDPSNIKTRTHLLQLLFDQDCLTPTSFRFLFAWLEVVGCSLYHIELKAYCRRHEIKIPEWDNLVPPLKERYPNAGESKYNTHPRSCPKSFPATESLPAAAIRDGGMIDSQSLSLRSKPPLPFPNSGGRKSDHTPSPTASYMYRDSTEHPVEASGPTAMVTAVSDAPNSEIVLVPGHEEKALGVGSVASSHQFPPIDLKSDDSGDESNDESGNSTELHHPQSESSREGQEGKLHVDKWPSSNLPRSNERMTNVVGINDDTSVITTMDIGFSQIMKKGKERICKLRQVLSEKYRQTSVKYCCCKLLVIVALVICIGGVSGGLTYHYIGSSPGDTSVTLAQNATVNIGCFDLLHIGHFIILAVAQTSFKFLAVPSSSVVPTKISFPDVNYKRAGTGYYISLNYYHTGYYDPLYSAGSGTVSYYTNFTNFDPSSCFYLYLFNSLDSYHEVLKNLGPARGFINKFVFCPNSTDKVFNFTFPLHTVGFYYVAAFMPSNMNIDVKISAEIFTYDITYLEGLGVQSCLLDDGKCLLDVGHHPVHAHSESVCLLASSSSQLYGETINGTVSPQRYLYNARTVSTFLTGCVFVVSIIILCPCIFCIITKFCASRRKSRDGYLSL